jgi:hypothetical protein
MEGSEIDDLDNEVSNIARKFNQKRHESIKGTQSNQASEANLHQDSEIDHSDIKLQLGD